MEHAVERHPGAAGRRSSSTRRAGDPEKSYVARLFAKGADAMLKKIGEEATEVVMACKDGDRAADRRRGRRPVVPLDDRAGRSFGLAPADVLAELERREGLSGLEEFAARKMQAREKDRAHERRSSRSTPRQQQR